MRSLPLLVVLALCAAVSLLAALLIGSVPLSVAQVLDALFAPPQSGAYSGAHGGAHNMAHDIVWQLRAPRALAAFTSTLSTPVPARAITRNLGAASISSAVTLVALRTMIASASARSAFNCSTGRPGVASTVQPSARSKSAADAGRSSAITIFMGVQYKLFEVARRRTIVVQSAKRFDFGREFQQDLGHFNRLFHRNCERAAFQIGARALRDRTA